MTINKDYFDSGEVIFSSDIPPQQLSISEFRAKTQQKLRKKEIQYLNLFAVALDEVVTNIAEHGLNFDENRKINITILYKDGQLCVELMDDGPAFDLNKNRAKSPKRQFDKGADGGYGMFILKRVFHHIEYFQRENKNITQLFFDSTKIKIPK